MTDRLYVVGLTGPTGSGKSEVARVLGEEKLPVIDADVLARRVVEPGSDCLRELAEAFSADVINSDGSLNRHRLAERAFVDSDHTKLLNSITHPYIIEMTKKILMRMEQAHERVTVIDAPLLYESGMDTICNQTVAVVAPFETRLRRICRRDGLTETQARTRMAAQQPEEYYTSRAAVVLRSEGSLDALQTQAKELAKQIREWANGN